MDLGELVEVPLREIWNNEQYDFSPWLSKPDNIRKLGDKIGIDITVDGTEVPVGSKYWIDIYGHETDNDENRIIIENQLEDTNHDHLGKVITYASGKDARTMIWVVKRAQDEHRQAVDWLNAHTDSDLNFFLVEVKAYKIGDSKAAPLFNVVCKPNDWGRAQRTASSNITPGKKLHLEYWQSFNEYLAEHDVASSEINQKKATTDHWYSIYLGSSDYKISLICNTDKSLASVYFEVKNDNKDIYDTLFNKKDKIEEETGLKFKWEKNENKKTSFIKTNIKADWDNREKWDDYSKWLCETAICIKKTFLKILK